MKSKRREYNHQQFFGFHIWESPYSPLTSAKASEAPALSNDQIKALRERWQSERYSCYICGKTFSSNLNYRVHRDQHERQEQEKK